MTDKCMPPAWEPPTGQTSVIAAAFQALFGLDADFEAPVGQPEARPALRPGRPTRSDGGLASRRLTHPLAQVYVASTLAEVVFLPLCVAHSAQERDRLNLEIGQVLALDRALAAGLITGWTVCWPPGRFPKTPSGVRLRTNGGKGARERCLGELAPRLREYVEWMKEVHGERYPSAGR